ncbi:MAG TPA: helix-turn-helix domain-containing protein [Solirubrobacteraceae bacterium]|nr:helix-turn-helix domain-containing protein [Solirubrobacteraceae bacterium]
MPSRRGDAWTRAGEQWPERPQPPRQPNAAPLFGYLLDLDDDLAEGVEVRMRVSARQHATARLLDAEVGECDLSSWFASVGRGPGLLIVDGLLAVDTRVADRTTTELLGAGDLLQPPGGHDDELVERETIWRALHASRLALLDSDFVDRIRSWPQILNALFRRAERRSDDLDVMRAISSQPRLEVRLVLLLWHLATRWGRVEPTGLRLTLPLTHRALGQLVAAERPSISHALRRLSQAGIVTGTAGDWHLHGSVESHMESLIERTGRLTLSEQSAAPSAQRLG